MTVPSLLGWPLQTSCYQCKSDYLEPINEQEFVKSSYSFRITSMFITRFQNTTDFVSNPGSVTYVLAVWRQSLHCCKPVSRPIKQGWRHARGTAAARSSWENASRAPGACQAPKGNASSPAFVTLLRSRLHPQVLAGFLPPLHITSSSTVSWRFFTMRGPCEPHKLSDLVKVRRSLPGLSLSRPPHLW